MSKKVSVVLPCRKGSKRIKNKNIKKFYEYEMGLFELKLEQLLNVEKIDSIFVSTDDDKIINFIKRNHSSFKKEIILEKRPDHLAIDDCLGDLIIHLSHIVPTDVLIWTHVTSPFFTSENYNEAIDLYFNMLETKQYDSLVSVSSVHTFAIQGGKWISHDTSIKQWPRKQDVEKMMLINGAIYIIDRSLMQLKKDRIGNNPYFFELKGLSGFDIDYEEDFSIAEKIVPCILK